MRWWPLPFRQDQMKIILRASRALIAIVTSIHISALRASVRLNDGKVVAARKFADAAALSVTITRAALYEATAFRDDAVAFEDDAIAANAAYRTAATAEASSLRRDFAPF